MAVTKVLTLVAVRRRCVSRRTSSRRGAARQRTRSTRPRRMRRSTSASSSTKMSLLMRFRIPAYHCLRACRGCLMRTLLNLRSRDRNSERNASQARQMRLVRAETQTRHRAIRLTMRILVRRTNAKKTTTMTLMTMITLKISFCHKIAHQWLVVHLQLHRECQGQ